MLPLHPSLAASPPRPPAAGQSRDQKPKTLPCKYCNKRFRRVEHVQRHERTHTKEKPFSCGWDRCGTTFGRRATLGKRQTYMDISDLLVRHEKLVHLNDGGKENSRLRRPSPGAAARRPSGSDGHVETDGIDMQQASLPAPAPPAPPPPQRQDQPQQQRQHQKQYHHGSALPNARSARGLGDPRGTARPAPCNLDVLSDAALATEVNPPPPMMNGLPQHHATHGGAKGYGEALGGYAERPREEQQELPSAFAPQPTQPTYDDYNLFLDEFAATPNLLPPHFEPDQHVAMWSRSSAQMHPRANLRPPAQFPSRFGSLGPDISESVDAISRPHDDASRAPSLRISAVDHSAIKNRIDEYSSVLPDDFVFPSRHTLTRFLEGYIGGFHEHLPFLHLPTLAPAELAPELLLAIQAVGAQYRFESNRGYALWYAAKAVAMEQVRRRHSSEVYALLPTAAAYSPHSTRPSPSISYRHSFASAQSERPATQDTHREPYSPNTPQARMETIQAALLLFAVGLWGAKTILQDALSLQSTLALLIRQEGLSIETSQTVLTDWDAWVRLEGANRTKLVAYCFFNLCSAAYDMPPLLMTSELNLYLPLRSRLWRAETAWQWQELRQSTPVAEITVHEAFSRLFGRTNQGLPVNLPSLGHYVLMHALIQHVYLLKQTSFAVGSPHDVQPAMKPEDVEEVTQALRVWQMSFESRRRLKAAESGHFDPSLTGGSLTFNATALLRLVYIRLNTDMPPSRSLETRDSMLIASALSATPLLLRSLKLHRALCTCKTTSATDERVDEDERMSLVLGPSLDGGRALCRPTDSRPASLFGLVPLSVPLCPPLASSPRLSLQPHVVSLIHLRGELALYRIGSDGRGGVDGSSRRYRYAPRMLGGPDRHAAAGGRHCTPGHDYTHTCLAHGRRGGGGGIVLRRRLGGSPGAWEMSLPKQQYYTHAYRNIHMHVQCTAFRPITDTTYRQDIALLCEASGWTVPAASVRLSALLACTCGDACADDAMHPSFALQQIPSTGADARVACCCLERAMPVCPKCWAWRCMASTLRHGPHSLQLCYHFPRRRVHRW